MSKWDSHCTILENKHKITKYKKKYKTAFIKQYWNKSKIKNAWKVFILYGVKNVVELPKIASTNLN